MHSNKTGNATVDDLQIIYREWGDFCTNRQKLDTASKYYDIALNTRNDPTALYNRSRCKRRIAQTNASLQDAKAAAESNRLNLNFALEVVDAIYDLNEFERARCDITNRSTKFTGIQLQPFTNRADVLEIDFDATLGKTLSYFMEENMDLINQAFEDKIRRENIDKRPLWKILREQNLCDLFSVIEEEKKPISPMEIARRNLTFHVYTQIYLHKNWIDVLFAHNLRSHKHLLEQFKWSTPQINELIQNKYEVAIKFLQMLHARAPLYTKTFENCPSKKLKEKIKSDHLFRVQYQVHRNTHIILNKAKQLRKNKQVEKLTSYLEEIMGDYIVLKSRRVLPWKFEFINEVYNILALAHIEQQIEIPKNLPHETMEDNLNLLLKMPKLIDTNPVEFKFGDVSSYQGLGIDPREKLRQFLDRMDKRLYFAKYPIEKTYVLHEMARAFLKQSRLDECAIMARKGIEEAQKCNSYVWNFLGLMQICKSLAVLHKIEKIQDILVETKSAAECLNNQRVLEYVKKLVKITQEELVEKKYKEEYRKSKSMQSMLSSGNKTNSNVSLS